MSEKQTRIQGSVDLTFDAVRETTNLVQRTHRAASDRVFRRIDALAPAPIASAAGIVRAVHNGISTGVYSAIRGANSGIGKMVDLGRSLAPAGEAQNSNSKLADNLQGALNGVYGDYLERRENGLAQTMDFRREGKSVPLTADGLRDAYPDATGRICVFVHGLSCTEWSWNVAGEKFHGDAHANFGTLLQSDLGYTPFYVRYNTGLHISENARGLSELMDELTRVYPAEISEIVLVGHSMGGLVARGAAAHGDSAGEYGAKSWTRRLRHVFCIGSPHQGAPLEKAANLLSNVLNRFDTAGTKVPAEILNSRSAGIKDLRFGSTSKADWEGRDPDALLEDHREGAAFVPGVDYYFIAATIIRDAEHPMGVLLGDLLVRLPSAMGHAPDPARRIPFQAGRVFQGMNHLHLANHPDVYASIKAWLKG